MFLVLVHMFRRFLVMEVTWLLISSFLVFEIGAHTSTAASAFSFDAKVSRFGQLLGLNESRFACWELLFKRGKLSFVALHQLLLICKVLFEISLFRMRNKCEVSATWLSPARHLLLA